MHTILLDMDGVIADFIDYFKKCLNVDKNYIVKTWDINKEFGPDANKLYNKLRKDINFWVSIPETKYFNLLYKKIILPYKNHIVISTDAPHLNTQRGKLIWLNNRNLDFLPVVFRKDKYQMANENTLLIDDNEDYINLFKNVKNRYNQKNKMLIINSEIGQTYLFPATYNKKGDMKPEDTIKELEIVVKRFIHEGCIHDDTYDVYGKYKTTYCKKCGKVMN